MRIRVLISLLCLSILATSLPANSEIAETAGGNYELLPAIPTTQDVRTLDRPVNPDTYLVGPGDEFLVNLNLEQVEVFLNVISPVGELLLPGIGSVDLNGTTLTEAIDRVEDACVQRYPLCEVFVSLQSIRTFNIYLRPAGFPEQAVTVTPVTRVGDVVRYFIETQAVKNLQERELQLQADQAHQSGSFQRFDRQSYLLPQDSPASISFPGFEELAESGLSYRNIILYRDREIQQVDLLRFQKLHEQETDPYLHEGDIIDIPPLLHTVQIEGGVVLPGVYEFSEGDTFERLLNLAGGFLFSADSSHFRLYRFVDSNRQDVTDRDVTADRGLHLKQEDFVFIPRNNAVHRLDKVVVSGEVRFPGIYPIEHGVTSISEIIALAGGRLATANPDKLLVLSGHQDIELSRLESFDYADLSNPEVSYIRSREQIPPGTAFISGAVGRQAETLVLFNGDEVYVPRLNNYVEVIGAVNAPGRQVYHPDMSWRDYIGQAGGKRRTATNRVFVVKPETGVRFPVKDVDRIVPGDVIFVEEKVELTRWEYFRDILSATASIVTMLAVVLSLTR